MNVINASALWWAITFVFAVLMVGVLISNSETGLGQLLNRGRINRERRARLSVNAQEDDAVFDYVMNNFRHDNQRRLFLKAWEDFRHMSKSDLFMNHCDLVVSSAGVESMMLTENDRNNHLHEIYGANAPIDIESESAPVQDEFSREILKAFRAEVRKWKSSDDSEEWTEYERLYINPQQAFKIAKSVERGEEDAVKLMTTQVAQAVCMSP